MALEEIFAKILSYGDNYFAQLLTKLIVAFIILLIGFILGRASEKVLYKFLHEIELNAFLKKAKLNLEAEKSISKLSKLIIYFIFVIFAFNEIGITATIFNIILVAAITLIIISLLLAVKDFIPNFISGLVIYLKSLIKIGDKVKLENVEGEVVSLSLLEAQVKTKKGDIIHVPSSYITKKEAAIKKS